MQLASADAVSSTTLLKLGRVSNLPTVWSNVLAGTAISHGVIQDWRTCIVVLAMSLLYVGGMYLNDYFDRAIDARERPQRPIPSGEISAAAVSAAGFGLLGLGVVLMMATGVAAAIAGLFLALAIILYDRFHKGNPVAPVIMGLCRALVYCSAAAAAVATVPVVVAMAGLAMLAYVAGLTYAARQESFDRVGNLWPLLVLIVPLVLALPALREGAASVFIYFSLLGCEAYAIYLLAARPMPGAVPRAVGIMIAGISLVDAALLASNGAVGTALVAMIGFPATVLLQRFVPGT